MLALLLVPGVAASSDFVPPEVQFSLQHLKNEERARAAQALGPLEELPRYQVQLEVDPKARRVKGHVRVDLLVHNRPLEAVHLRVTPNAFDPRVELSEAKVNGQPAKLQHLEDSSLYRVALPGPVAPGGSVVVEVDMDERVPRAQPGATSLMGSLSGSGGAGDYGAFSATEDRKSTRLNSSHSGESRMPSSA